MATLLFYQKPVQLNSEQHRATRLGTLGGNFNFSKDTNSIPLAAVEFFDTAREYPIAFTGREGGALFPIALIGIRQNENLFVTPEGKWEGRYIPAFVRRYPFVLAEKQDAADFNVYLDESYPGFGAADGERLFTDNGEHTPLAPRGTFRRRFAATGAQWRPCLDPCASDVARQCSGPERTARRAHSGCGPAIGPLNGSSQGRRTGAGFAQEKTLSPRTRMYRYR